VGDLVLAYDEAAGSVVSRPVTRRFVHPGQHAGTLALDQGRTLRVTPNHPVYEPETGAYVEAGSIARGERLLTLAPRGGATSAISAGFTADYQGLPETVFNLEVDGTHNYFAAGVLVHNKGACLCSSDDDCAARLTAWVEPSPVSVSLVSTSCTHSYPGDPLPLCMCNVHIKPSDSSRDEFDTAFYPGYRGFPPPEGCSEYGRGPTCLYCADEFPGCNAESPGDTCTAICQDLALRVQQDSERRRALKVRVARCNSSCNCDHVFELDGQCYSGDVLPDALGYDCSLSDAELLAKGQNRQPSCPAPPVLRCRTTDDCPGGLACNSGRCGPCLMGSCSLVNNDPPSWTCEGDATCAAGEVFAAGLCIPKAQAACRDQFQCPGGECVLSGIDRKAIRGNSRTFSYCAPRTAGP